MQKNIEIVRSVFDWFNSLCSDGREVTREDVARFFTPDMRMVANNQLKCEGIEAHYKHFREIKAKMASFHVRPFEISLAEDDKVAAYYLIDFTTPDGKCGIVHDMAIWTVRDGKISSMTEVVHFEGKEVALENH